MHNSLFLPVSIDIQHGLGSLCSLAFCGNFNFFSVCYPITCFCGNSDNFMCIKASAMLSEWAEIEKWIQKVLGRKRAGMNKETQRERENKCRTALLL